MNNYVVFEQLKGGEVRTIQTNLTKEEADRMVRDLNSAVTLDVSFFATTANETTYNVPNLH